MAEHFVFSLSVTDDGQPWCAPCFYLYLPEEKSVIFVSEPHTRHIECALRQPRVSGSIYLETEKIRQIRGVQFRGTLLKPDPPPYYTLVRKQFGRRFPKARLKNTPLWLIRLTHVKYTDNRKGFGYTQIFDF